MAKKWIVAPSLETLLKQLNRAFPKRSKKSDGGIGDDNHKSRNSDHNPYISHPTQKGVGVVRARDFTHDPQTGIDCNWLWEVLLKNRDLRIRYIIWNHQIASPEKGWKRRKYSGTNAHTKHLHVSVSEDSKLFMSAKEWDLDFPDNEGTDEVARVTINEPDLNPDSEVIAQTELSSEQRQDINEPIVEEKPKPY